MAVVTPNIGLTEPAIGDAGWGVTLNTDLGIIDGIFGSTVAVPSQAITGVLTEGSGGVVGWSSNANPTLAVADTGLSRVAAKTVAVGSGVQGDQSGTLNATILQCSDFRSFNGTAAVVASSQPDLYGTSSAGAGYPFLEAGNLVIQSRSSGATRDIIFATGNPATFQWAVKRTGPLTGVAGNPLNWVAAADLSASPDTGISRVSAGVISLGNGSQADTTGNLQLNTITKYAGAVTAGNGVSSISAITSQKTESAADATLLTFTPPAVAGSYRVRFVLSISAANAAVVGWAITYHDSNGTAQAPTNLSLLQLGTALPALTFTTSTTNVYSGEVNIDIDNSATNIVVKFTLGSGTITAKATATIERNV